MATASYYYDSETGLYYLKSRYYSPVLERFLTRDAYDNINCKNPQTLNLYTYCGNDPVNNIDPNGNDAIGDMMAKETERFAAQYAAAKAKITVSTVNVARSPSNHTSSTSVVSSIAKTAKNLDTWSSHVGDAVTVAIAVGATTSVAQAGVDVPDDAATIALGFAGAGLSGANAVANVGEAATGQKTWAEATPIIVADVIGLASFGIGKYVKYIPGWAKAANTVVGWVATAFSM